MKQGIDEIVVAEDTPGIGQELESALLLSRRESLPQADNCGMVLSARDQQGVVVGFVATTSYG